MKNVARRALLTTIRVTVCLMLLLLVVICWRESQLPPDHRIEDYKLYLEAFKVILIGFGVALLGILVPAIFTEEQNNFERLKESRTAYSEAKTGVEYLPLRLCTLSLQDAAILVQSVHVHKHQAELYDELRQWLERKSGGNPEKEDPAIWGEKTYRKLSAIRKILEAHAASWDKLSPDARLKLLAVENQATEGPSETGS
ncbi:hypothetical protein NR798_25745 [Archangium gephyra]|uniref:hypothetical protein n=1 Tax=Archangium gephyra TaxID=48 RepID=UPI0035D3EE85